MSVVRLAEIRDTPVEIAEVLAAVDADSSGAVAMFVGRVRDHDSGDSVTWLDYSAHPSAAAVMSEVSAAVAAEYDVTALAVLHRTGRLEIGEAAIVAAVATSHRGSAFAACDALVTRLKASVPIWKHQGLADGREVWVGLGGVGASS